MRQKSPIRPEIKENVIHHFAASTDGSRGVDEGEERRERQTKALDAVSLKIAEPK